MCSTPTDYDACKLTDLIDRHMIKRLSIPIANGMIKANGACEIIKYFHNKHHEFDAAV